MSMRGKVLLLILFSLLAFWAALALAFAAGRASAAPLVVHDRGRANVQSVADRTADLLSGILRAPVEHRTVVVTRTAPDGSTAPPDWAGWYMGDARIYLRPWVARNLADRSPDLLAARVLRHELLHRPSDLDPTCPIAAREGVPDAISMDTEPQWARLFGFRDYYAATAGYPAEVRIVRRWSVGASGARAGSVAARQARRSLWPLSCHARARVMGLE